VQYCSAVQAVQCSAAGHAGVVEWGTAAPSAGWPPRRPEDFARCRPAAHPSIYR
jgi:hypothetical protein